MAEIEFSVLERQCLGRRLASLLRTAVGVPTLEQEEVQRRQVEVRRSLRQ